VVLGHLASDSQIRLVASGGTRVQCPETAAWLARIGSWRDSAVRFERSAGAARSRRATTCLAGVSAAAAFRSGGAAAVQELFQPL
jgi:hypothetical protein